VIRVAPVLALSGCLLGWEPDLDETGTASSGSSGPTTTTGCGYYDARSVEVDAAADPPVFSSDRGFSDLYVYLGDQLQWHAWSSDDANSLTEVVYGATPAGVSEGGAAVPLVVGTDYQLQLDALCDEGVSSVFRTFRPGG
jgi:hypothetical protein